MSRGGGETLTRQLTDQLRDLITGGRLAPGQLLPSSRDLAQSLDLSRNTVSFAIEQLAAEGYLTLSAGRRPAVAAGLVLDGRKVSSRSNRSTDDRIKLSAWARSLQRANWPPIHDGQPRPFQPGLADEREFPHDFWSRCLRRAARNAVLRRDRSINHRAAAGSITAASFGSSRDQGKSQPDPDRADGAIRPRAGRRGAAGAG